jgi:hypothetical protein
MRSVDDDHMLRDPRLIDVIDEHPDPVLAGSSASRRQPLARLSDGETLEASQAATVLTIPNHARGGAAIGGGGLWIARSDRNWGPLDRLDPVTGAPQRRYEIAPDTEDIAFGNAGRSIAQPRSRARRRTRSTSTSQPSRSPMSRPVVRDNRAR